MLRRLNWSWVYFIHTSLTRLATFIVSAEVGRSLRQGEDGAFGDSHFHSSSSLRVNDCVAPSFFLPFIFSFFSLFLCRQTSTPPEEEEINLHSYFLLRTKERTGLLPWAHFPSLLESSVCGVSLKQRPGRVLLPPHLVLLLFCVWFVSPLDAAPVLRKAMFTVDAACWNHPEKLWGVSEFTCPTFQASVFNIEQC